MAEPMTTATDYALALVAGWFALRLLRRAERETSRWLWSLAFVAIALSAALGGSYHGFGPSVGEDVQSLLWRATVLAIGLATFGMCAGSAFAVATGNARRVILALAASILGLYSAWMLGHDNYRFVIANTATAMFVLAVLHGWSAAVRREKASAWILGGVAVSVLAAIVQASGVDLHRNFNHNDLYHLIQIAGMALFYAGARRLSDR